jgi:hypothetical protein
MFLITGPTGLSRKGNQEKVRLEAHSSRVAFQTKGQQFQKLWTIFEMILKQNQYEISAKGEGAIMFWNNKKKKKKKKNK